MQEESTKSITTPLPRKASKQSAWLYPAKFVSWLFHPVLLPPLLMVVWYRFLPHIFFGTSERDFYKLLLIVTLNTTVFSALFVLICKGLGVISSLQMPTSKERIIPLMGVMVFYFWCNHVLGNIPNVPFMIRLMVLGYFWGVIALFMVNIFFKVSLHTAAAGSFVALFLVLLFISPVNMVLPLIVSIVIAGIIGTARLIVGTHRLPEIWIGYAVGFIVQLAAYFYLS